MPILDPVLMEKVFGKRTTKPADNPSQVAPTSLCSLYDVVAIVQKKFAFTSIDCGNLKAWFTISDLIESAKERGYMLSESQAEEFLSRLIKGRFLTTRTGVQGKEYHRIDIFLKGWEGRL